MPQFKLKFTLKVFYGLMSVKRALTFLFCWLGQGLERLGQGLTRVLIFPFYKIYLTLEQKLGVLFESFISRRQIFYFLFIILALILVIGESKVYASGKYLGGRYSLLFEYLGPEEGDIFEEGIEESVWSRPAVFWEIGSLAPSLPSAGEETEEISELVIPTPEQMVLMPPTIIPGAETGGPRYEIVKYAIQPGDTVGSLAQKFKINVETILIENKLTSRSLLRPGDVLSILPVSGVSHKVKKGDTLKKLAASYQAEAQKILDFNRLSADELTVGEVIIIPEGRRIVAPAPRQSIVARPPALKVVRPGMIWPTIGRRITQYFNWRHPGIDIAQPSGTPIYAVESGVIETAGWNRSGYGYQVVINHGNNLKTRYAHNSKNLVVAGQPVEKGEAIALVGSTGRSTGPHLHLEVIVGGVRVNPFLYVR